MIPYLGDFVEDDTVCIMFNTFTSDDPSASSTITNFVNTDVHIHKEDDLTQRNNAAGITVSVNFDGITGSHMIKIDTSDDTVGGFWVAGKDYFVRIEGTTVDGATINAVVAHFSIENRYMRGTDSAALASVLGVAVGASISADIAAATTELTKVPKSDGSSSWNATALAAIENECNDALVALKLDHLIHIAAAADEVADNSVIARLAAIDGDWSDYNSTTDALENLYNNLFNFGTLVTAINNLTKAAGAGDLAAIKAKTDNLPADPASETNVDANETKIDALPTAAAIKTAMETDGSMLEHLHEMTEDDGGVRRLTENALEQAPSGTGGDATAANQATIIGYTALAKKILANKAVQNKLTGVITYYDDDDITPLLTITPTDDGSLITRTPS